MDNTNMNDKMAKNKALDVMIAIGTKKGLGMKDNAMDSSSNQNDAENAAEDQAEGDNIDACDTCGKDVTCSGCDMKPSKCTC